jgi:hypothetical protein
MARLYAQGWLTPDRRVGGKNKRSDNNDNGADDNDDADDNTVPAPHPMNNGRQTTLPFHRTAGLHPHLFTKQQSHSCMLCNDFFSSSIEL